MSLHRRDRTWKFFVGLAVSLVAGSIFYVGVFIQDVYERDSFRWVLSGTLGGDFRERMFHFSCSSELSIRLTYVDTAVLNL